MRSTEDFDELLTTMFPDGPIISGKEFRDKMNIGHNRLHQLIDDGHLRAIRMGRRISIPPVECRRFLAAVMSGEIVIDAYTREDWLKRDRARVKTPRKSKRKDDALEST